MSEKTLPEAVADLKAIIVATPLMQAIKRFALRHPLVAWFSLPAMLLALAGLHTWYGRPVETIVLSAYALWLLRRAWR